MDQYILLHSSDGVLEADDEPIFAALSEELATGNKNVLMFLHGGLTSRAEGEADAQFLSTQFDAPYPQWLQVYVIWPTDVLSILAEHWNELANNDALYRALLEFLIQFLGGKALVAKDSGGHTLGQVVDLSPAALKERFRQQKPFPFGDLEQLITRLDGTVAFQLISDAEIAAGLQLHSGFNNALADLDAAITPGSQFGDAAQGRLILGRLNRVDRQSLERTAINAFEDDVTTKSSLAGGLILDAIDIIGRVLERFIERRDHGLYATIVEELLRELWGDFIGGGSWSGMKDDAADHFKQGALGSDLISAIASGPNNHLLLIGHSAGANWACDFITAAAGAGASFTTDVVFEAAAVRVDALAATLRVAGSNISKFRSFALTDDLERNDAVLNVTLNGDYSWIYPSSLLYLVCGLFERDNEEDVIDAPIAGMDRFIPENGEPPSFLNPTELEAVMEVLDFYKTKAPAAVYSGEFDAQGLQCSARDHGLFFRDPETIGSINYSFIQSMLPDRASPESKADS